MSYNDSNQVPLYEKIQNEIIEQIQRGIYKEGDRLPSEKELMNIYNVSRITATKALTELSLCGYISRIQGKGSFVNAIKNQWNPKGLKVNDTKSARNAPHNIVLVIPEFRDSHMSEIITGISEQLHFPAYFVSIVVCHDSESEAYALDQFIANGYDGVILFPADCEYYSNIILKMQIEMYPLVLIDRTFPGINCASIVSDNPAGISEALDCLLSYNHNNIAFWADCSYKEQITSIRYQAYVDFMTKHGLTVHPYENLFSSCPEKLSQFADDIIHRKITAIIVSNSHSASKIYEFCKSQGIKVPYELSIICFDCPEYNFEHNIKFTYINQHSYDMGKYAGELIKELTNNSMKTKQTDFPHKCLEPELVLGETVSYAMGRTIQ